jgi:predicted transposase YdaD
LQEGLAEGLAAGLAKGEAEGLAKGEAKGEAKGLAKAANQIAVNMLNSNISLDLIAQFTGLSLKQVEKLQNLSKKQSAMPKSSKTMRSLKP